MLFGTPSPDFLTFLHRQAPTIVIGGDYQNKTIELCALASFVCGPGGIDRAAHSAYLTNGMTEQAADFTPPSRRRHILTLMSNWTSCRHLT